MEDPAIKNIDPKKLDFLEKMFAEGKIFKNQKGKSQKQMMAQLMPMMMKAKQEKLTFTPQEMQAAINAIKKYSTEEELKQIDKILAQSKVGNPK